MAISRAECEARGGTVGPDDRPDWRRGPGPHTGWICNHGEHDGEEVAAKLKHLPRLLTELINGGGLVVQFARRKATPSRKAKRS